MYDYVIELFNTIATSLDRNEIIAVVFFDISKAFDTICHEVLFDKLERYGIRGIPLDLIKSYFNGRMQAVNFNGSLCDYLTTSRGIGQGTPSGPYYFVIKLDDFKNLPMKGKTSRFADDVCSYVTGRPSDIISLLALLKHDIELVEEYHTINGLTLNTKKTKFMIIAKPRVQLDEGTINKFSLDNGIERVTMQTYLGVPIDHQFSIKPRISQLIRKMSPIVSVLSKMKWYLPTGTLLKIYFGHIHSHLSNIPQVLSIANCNEINSLQVLQNRALKHVYKLPIRFSSIELFRDVSKTILPVRGIIMFSTLTFIHKSMLGILQTDLKFDISKKGLRNDGKIIPQSNNNSSLMRNDISCLGVKHYNDLLLDLRALSDPEKFKTKLKDHLLKSHNAFL